MVFGFGYAGDTFSKRLARYGPDRETPTTILVLLFFLVAVVTVAFILVFLALDQGAYICLGPCRFSIHPPGVDNPWYPLRLTTDRLGEYAAAGVGASLAGSAQLLFSLFLPRKVDDSIYLSWRRIGFRMLDVLILFALVFGVGYVLEGRVSGRLLVTWVIGAPFLYEFLPGVLPRFSGKWWPGLQVVSTPDEGRVVLWRFAVRALFTSAVFSAGVDLGTVIWTGTVSYESWIIVTRAIVIVAMGASSTVHQKGQGLHDVLLRTHVPTKPHIRSRRPNASSPIQGRRLRLRPTEFSADESDPFENDLLDRQPQVEYLSAVITKTDGPGAVMVNAPWGAGKTAFLRMCAAHLRSQGVMVAEFNAWADQHTRQPVLDLVGALSARLPKAAAERIREGASGLVTLLTAAEPDPRIASWHEHRRSVESFTATLASVASEHGRIVVVVDELDRCHPDYVLEALADIHHRFSVDGVGVLLGVNRDQLHRAIQSLYGDNFSADAYLRRFADHQIDLRRPSHADLGAFLDHLFRESQLRGPGLARNRLTVAVLRLVIELKTCNLRDLQQASHMFALALYNQVPQEHPYDAWQISVAAMIVLRVADRDAYNSFVHGACDNFDALTAAYKAFGPEPEPPSATNEMPPGSRRDYFAAALLNIGTYGDNWCDKSSEAAAAFADRYRHAYAARLKPRHGPRPDMTEAVSRVLRCLCQIRDDYHPQVSPRAPEAIQLADLIDMR